MTLMLILILIQLCIGLSYIEDTFISTPDGGFLLQVSNSLKDGGYYLSTLTNNPFQKDVLEQLEVPYKLDPTFSYKKVDLPPLSFFMLYLRSYFPDYAPFLIPPVYPSQLIVFDNYFKLDPELVHLKILRTVNPKTRFSAVFFESEMTTTVSFFVRTTDGNSTFYEETSRTVLNKGSFHRKVLIGEQTNVQKSNADVFDCATKIDELLVEKLGIGDNKVIDGCHVPKEDVVNKTVGAYFSNVEKLVMDYVSGHEDGELVVVSTLRNYLELKFKTNEEFVKKGWKVGTALITDTIKQIENITNIEVKAMERVGYAVESYLEDDKVQYQVLDIDSKNKVDVILLSFKSEEQCFAKVKGYIPHNVGLQDEVLYVLCVDNYEGTLTGNATLYFERDGFGVHLKSGKASVEYTECSTVKENNKAGDKKCEKKVGVFDVKMKIREDIAFLLNERVYFESKTSNGVNYIEKESGPSKGREAIRRGIDWLLENGYFAQANKAEAYFKSSNPSLLVTCADYVYDTIFEVTKKLFQ
ncbi:hypothetical protein EIN_043910 [Entamoeba invadens IP1]|uniref:Uncharacterized protein n=1 Tax=Entamoeba invadens IP1 TaxID=370355 RepID=A0A0A1U2I1_ENTIV|nr:hypothetical protein EIN_043910 [Entamoeba invadens IP1]ELP86843.1 hypothetical protein EIN_043910 [Entamoeba invadens IP1]|eukprot:XP_004253614.1 hypothetical protein EIN_043910 [Entamoeba invadens IP1]